MPDQTNHDVKSTDLGPHPQLVGLSIAEITAAMEEGSLTSRKITQMYLERIACIDADGPTLRSVLEVNPDAVAIADQMDSERASGKVRGPLHGVPVLVKDNFDTADAMHTTAGSLALMTSTPQRDATAVAQLRAAGAVILGKANLSEWSYMRDTGGVSGWSARGGFTRNPHSLSRTPSGSSSGSAVAVAAGLAAIALGTETDGSIVCPASASGVVGYKPTVGLTSRAGVIPISHSQDSVGLLGTSVRDVATAIAILTGVDDRDPATSASEPIVGTDFLANLDSDALRGARLGVPTNFGLQGYDAKTDTIFGSAVEVLVAMGAEVVTPTDIPTAIELSKTNDGYDRMIYEFKRDMNAYLAERNDPDIRSIADLIEFNKYHGEEEMHFFGQNHFERAEATRDDDAAEIQELDERLKRLSRAEGIDAVLTEHKLDALIAPTMAPASMSDLINGGKFPGAVSALPAIAGYPVISVPAGLVYGMPVGLSFIGTAWSDAKLLSLAYAWEQATHMFRKPTYAVEDIARNPDVPRLEIPSVK